MMTTDSLQQLSNDKKIPTKNSPYILAKAVEKGLWPQVKEIVINCRNKEGKVKLKQLIGTEVSSFTFYKWRKKARQNISFINDDVSQPIKGDIIKRREQARKLLLNKDTMMKLVTEKLNLFETQRERIENMLKLEQSKLEEDERYDYNIKKEQEMLLKITDSLINDLKDLGIMGTSEKEISDIDGLMTIIKNKIDVRSLILDESEVEEKKHDEDVLQTA